MIPLVGSGAILSYQDVLEPNASYVTSGILSKQSICKSILLSCCSMLTMVNEIMHHVIHYPWHAVSQSNQAYFLNGFPGSDWWYAFSLQFRMSHSCAAVPLRQGWTTGSFFAESKLRGLLVPWLLLLDALHVELLLVVLGVFDGFYVAMNSCECFLVAHVVVVVEGGAQGIIRKGIKHVSYPHRKNHCWWSRRWRWDKIKKKHTCSYY